MTEGNRVATLKAALKDQVADFVLVGTTATWPGGCDELFASLRKFYLLIPVQGFALNWGKRGKHARRQVIQTHLQTVCMPGSVEDLHVQRVDGWLANISAPRDRVIQFGRMLHEKYGSNCFICGRPIKEQRSVDHILPITRGGADELSNLLLCHHGCNSSKNNLLLGDNIIWAPPMLDTDVSDIPPRLRYLVHLRDNFTCTNPGCGHGLFDGTPITVSTTIPSGIACYDNLRVECDACSPEEVN